MKVVFNFPAELEEMKTLIERYENADGKATDTLAPKSIVAQNEPKAQEEDGQITLDGFLPDYTGEELDSILKALGLTAKESSGMSANLLSCRKHLIKNLGRYGRKALINALETIKKAWPKGGEKWHWKIVQDVWAFYSEHENEDIDMDMLARHLSKRVASQEQITPEDFIEMLTDVNGEATLRRYNSGCSFSRLN